MHSTMMHMPMTVQMLMQHGLDVYPNSQVGTFDGDIILGCWAIIAEDPEAEAAKMGFTSCGMLTPRSLS